MTDDDKVIDLRDTNKDDNAESAPQQATPAAAPGVSEDTPPAPLPASAEVLRERTIQMDMARILKDSKLPERHDFKAAADVPKPPPKPAEEPVAQILEERVVKASAPAAPVPEPTLQPPEPAPIIATPAPEKPPVTASPAKAKGESVSSIVTPLRTLKDDLQSIVRDKKISLVRAVSLEQEKKKGQAHLIPPEQERIRAQAARRTLGIVFASLVLVLLGVGALFGVFYVMQKQQTPIAQTAPNTSILFAEQTEALPLDRATAQDLKNEFLSFTSKPPGPLGSITRVVPTLTATTSGTTSIRPATLSEFFDALDIHPPQELMSALGSDFFFGVHVVDKNAPIFVIPVQSYDRAFAGMLAWEATMNGDLTPIFTAVPMTKYVGTSTIPVARTFQDVVLRNYDARALEDDTGAIQMYYSFPTPNILVIAESPYSFSEILNRLQAQREL